MGRLLDWRKWPFAMRVIVPASLAVVLAFGSAALFAFWSIERIDNEALSRQVQLVRHILEKERDYLAAAQDDVSPDDDAVAALDARPMDLDFLDETLGGDFFDNHASNKIYVLDHQLQPVYAMQEGGKATVESFSPDAEVVRALAERVQDQPALTAIDAFEHGRGGVPTSTDFVRIDGRAALASIIPILGDSDDVVVPSGKAYLHVAIRFLDATLAAELEDDYLLRAPRFAPDAAVAGPEVAIPIVDQDGTSVAWFKWLPDRPGAQLMMESGPSVLAAMLAGALVLGHLLRQVSKSAKALEAARNDAQHKSVHDPLTGLANRFGFEESLRQVRAELGRGGQPAALLALDLDRFKQVNDTLGHDAGDALLRQVAGRLRLLVRETDTIARLGGDEFIVLMHRIDSPSDSTALAARIVARIAEPYMLGDHDARIGVSIGVALASTVQDLEDLASRADAALYHAKDGGRNQFRMETVGKGAAVVTLDRNRVA